MNKAHLLRNFMNDMFRNTGNVSIATALIHTSTNQGYLEWIKRENIRYKYTIFQAYTYKIFLQHNGL